MLFTRAVTSSLLWSAPAMRSLVRTPPLARTSACNMATFDGSTPFILLARCHVKPEFAAEYLEAARVADEGVKASEPGMLHHTFDQDPSDPLAFVWSEVYANDEALLKHLANPPLQKFVEQHLEMGDSFAVEVYGTLAPETKEAFTAAGNEIGFEVKYFDSKLGYSRVA